MAKALARKSLDRLDELSTSINAEVANARSLASQATWKYIAIGYHLVEARELMRNDTEFGKWRETEVDMSAQDATRLMQIIRDEKRLIQPTSAGVERPPLKLSILSELVSASDEVVEEVMAQAKDPSKPDVTVKEVRDKKKENTEAETLPADEEKGPTAPVTVDSVTGKPVESAVIASMKPKTPPPPSLPKFAQIRIDDLDPIERLKMFRDTNSVVDEDSLVALGIGSQFSDTAPSDEVLQIVHSSLAGTINDLANEGRLKEEEAIELAIKLDEALKKARELGQEIRDATS